MTNANLPVPISSAATVAAGKFAIATDRARAEFVDRRIYPVQLAEASVNEAVVQLYVQWLDLTETKFNPSSRPWLPVGRVGPMLILGHHDPHTDPMLPPDWSQPVVLTVDDYDRHLRLIAPVIASTVRPDWEETLASPRSTFPGLKGDLVRPRSMRAALRFLIEYFPHRREDLAKVQDVMMESEQIRSEDLPPGYLGACCVLLRESAIADPTLVEPPARVQQKVPQSVAGRIRIISELNRNVWVGAERLPQPDVEDILLNELGDGWHVHFLLLDGFRFLNKTGPKEPYPVPGAEMEEEDRGSGRPRVRIEDRARARMRQEGNEPGIIRLSQKDIRELDAYNPRRADRDPVKVFLKELSAGIQHGATDLHIEVDLDKYQVRARIDGHLEQWLEMPSDFGRMVVGAAKERFGLNAERFIPEDGSCTVYHGGDIVNLRISAYPIRGQQKLAIRYLPRRGAVPSLSEIMPPAAAALVRRAINRPYGLILFCGPTGSGKTTTTAAALAEINQPNVNITTMEDPVEYEMAGSNQAELDERRGVTWQALLKGFLRQDPDIGVVGEVRDLETAETVIRVTLTGHVVFATMHTISCAHTVERIVDMGVNAQMFSNAVTLIVSQRLLRRLCPECKSTTRRPPTEPEKALFKRHAVEPPVHVFDAAKCDHCRKTGYKGQVAAVEVLPITEEVAQMIAEKRPARVIENWMREKEFPRIYQAALTLVAKGDTTLAEANEWQAVWEDLQITANK